MSATRDVNKVILIGNLTRDPELRYTPQGTAVANFTVATNRSWMVDGTEKEVVDFHSIVAWNKLAELCAQLLTKGTKVYVEGRLQTRSWDGEGGKKYKTEVNIEEMIVLTRKAGSTSQDDHATGSQQDTNTNGDAAAPVNSSDVSTDADLDKLLAEIDADTQPAETE